MKPITATSRSLIIRKCLGGRLRLHAKGLRAKKENESTWWEAVEDSLSQTPPRTSVYGPFADWLEEQGDARAEPLRVLFEQGIVPATVEAQRYYIYAALPHPASLPSPTPRHWAVHPLSRHMRDRHYGGSRREAVSSYLQEYIRAKEEHPPDPTPHPPDVREPERLSCRLNRKLFARVRKMFSPDPIWDAIEAAPPGHFGAHNVLADWLEEQGSPDAVLFREHIIPHGISPRKLKSGKYRWLFREPRDQYLSPVGVGDRLSNSLLAQDAPRAAGGVDPLPPGKWRTEGGRGNVVFRPSAAETPLFGGRGIPLFSRPFASKRAAYEAIFPLLHRHLDRVEASLILRAITRSVGSGVRGDELYKIVSGTLLNPLVRADGHARRILKEGIPPPLEVRGFSGRMHEPIDFSKFEAYFDKLEELGIPVDPEIRGVILGDAEKAAAWAAKREGAKKQVTGLRAVFTRAKKTSIPVFEAAIEANPKDDGPRLVYADWLEEQGETDYAAFFRNVVVPGRVFPTPWEASPKPITRLFSWKRGGPGDLTDLSTHIDSGGHMPLSGGPGEPVILPEGDRVPPWVIERMVRGKQRIPNWVSFVGEGVDEAYRNLLWAYREVYGDRLDPILYPERTRELKQVTGLRAVFARAKKTSPRYLERES